MKIFYSILIFSSFFFIGNAHFHNENISLLHANPLSFNLPEPLCSPVKLNTTESKKVDTQKKQKTVVGIASFYSKSLEGTETATGETFSQKLLTAASNEFKLNSLVRVTNLSTGKSAVVRINDRMHPKMARKGRVIDLTLSAAKKIGLSVLSGITKVKIEKIDKSL